MFSIVDVTGYVKGMTNYTLVNSSNFYNFLISILEPLPEDSRKRFIQSLRIHMGITVTEDFKKYIFKKLPGTSMLTCFN